MVSNKHLTAKDRIFLGIMLEKRYSEERIAAILNVDPSELAPTSWTPH